MVPCGVVLLCLTTGGGAIAEELAAGPWAIAYDGNGVRSVAYDGTPVLGPLSVSLYKPDYKGAEFALTEAEVQRLHAGDTGTLVFSREVPGKARAVGTLEVQGDRLRWSVAMEMQAQGHLEIHVPVPRATAEAANGDVCFATDGREWEVTRGHSWETLLPREVRLEGARLDLLLRPQAGEGRWLFQDRREDTPPYVRMVGVAESTGEETVRLAPALEIEARPLSAEEARARGLRHGQTRMTLTEAPVANAGFEEGLNGWDHGGNARVTEEDPAEGKACARLELTDINQPFYITQQVPVTPGAAYRVSCRLRIEDVRRAEGMRMSSVGAVLIHEWADPQGKWKYPGAYSESTWGTGGWKTVRCDELVAPEGAGFAILFLGLRGLGAAYFDEVTLTEIKEHVVLAAPLDGAALPDNRPRLAWRPLSRAPGYRVLLRGPEGTREEACSEPSWRPPAALAPGEYEWQVGAPGAEASVAWHFSQTAAQAADTTGPDASLAPQNLAAPDAALRVVASDPSGVDWTKTRVQIDGGDSDAAVAPAKGGAVLQAPTGGWPIGGFAVKVTVADPEGNTAEAQSWAVSTPPPPKALTWTYDRGVFDGERRFLPLAMYQVPPDQMPRVKQAGFNTVHVYTFESSQDDAAARAYLDACQANGLQAFIGFDRGLYSGSGLIQMNLEHVARRIGALRDHPALLAWYLFDEPDLHHQYVPPANLRRLYEFIKTLDPYHPVIVTFAVDQTIDQYPQAYDVHWTQAYGATEYVRSRMLRHRGLLPSAAPGGDGGESIPIATILHCFDREQSEVLKGGGAADDARFALTTDKLKADVAMALALHSSGLAWWWYGDGRRQWLTAADIPSAWAGLMEAVAEVHTLEPLLTDEGQDIEVTLQTDPVDARIVARARRVGNRVLVLIASAEEEKDVPVTVRIPGLPQGAAATVLFGNRTDRLAAGALQDVVPRNGRQVYEIAW